MGRGSSKAGSVERYKGGKGVNLNNVKNESDLVSARGSNRQEVDDVLTVSNAINDQYGGVGDFNLADITGNDAGTLAFYDANNNITFNRAFFDGGKMDKAYDDSVASGFHPSRGNKSGIEAVAAHEFGHNLTDQVAQKMGVSDLHEAATIIVKEAAKDTKHKGVVQMASKISKYATATNAEAVAEAFSDVYCNGRKAKKESRAIMKVVNKYLGT